jgi:hypothetical protein
MVFRMEKVRVHSFCRHGTVCTHVYLKHRLGLRDHVSQVDHSRKDLWTFVSGRRLYNHMIQ